MDELESKLGHKFSDPELLKLALTHPSIVHEKGGPVVHNQRLEFLGDAVLQLVLTRELYLRHPTLGEGSLTKARATLVNSTSLAEKGAALGLGGLLLLSRGEQLSGGRERPSALTDAYEAVLGALYLDGGLQAAGAFILRDFADLLEGIDPKASMNNPKGELQELFQSQDSGVPEYRLVSSAGPDHDRFFESVVECNGKELGRGSGKSKKIAESEAALSALERLKTETGAADVGKLKTGV